MSAILLVKWVSIIELLLCFGVLSLLWTRKAFGDFRLLTALLLTRGISGSTSLAVLFFRKELGISKIAAYGIYFYTYWPAFFIQLALTVGIVYAVYSLVLEPFEPLKRLGQIMFRWVTLMSVAVSVGVAFGPHVFGRSFAANLIGQLQQTASVLTLCLLAFVCFALRPLGLSVRSRAFGVCLGIGVLAATQLLQSSWLPTPTALSVYSMLNFYSGLGFCAALVMWGTYFALEEPERRMVLLPTTSPYFLWNKISEALGDAPGFVAIRNFTPECMAPGELEALSVASQVHAEEGPRVLKPIAIQR